MANELLIVFQNSSTVGTEIIVADPTTITAPNYVFTAVNNDFIPGHYTNTGSAYSYNQPNPSQFVASVTADTTLTALVTLLESYISAMMSYSANPAMAQSVWSYLVATYGPSGSNQMTSTQITTIQGYAVNNNMPLVG